MTISLSRRKKLARELLRENRKKGRAWRTIAKEDYDNTVHYATLCRIAITKGEWIPKDERLLLALGLIKLKKPRKPRKKLHEMSRTELLAMRQRYMEKIQHVNNYINALDQKQNITTRRPAHRASK